MAIGTTRQEGESDLSNSFACTLVISNQDSLLTPETGFVAGSAADVIAFGCEAKLALTDYSEDFFPGPPLTWSAAKKTAWNTWYADVPGGYDTYRTWCYTAILDTNSAAAEDVAYKVFGLVYDSGDPATLVWVGDTSWEEEAVFGVTGIEVTSTLDTGSSVNRQTPRYYSDITCERAYRATATASGTVTMAGSTQTELYGAGSAAWMLDNIQINLSVHKSPASVCYVQLKDIRIGGVVGSGVDVPIESCDFYFQNTWRATHTPPPKWTWRCYGSTNDNTVKLISKAADTNTRLCQFQVQVKGPVRFVGGYGRMWPGHEIALPDGCFANTPVVLYVDEGHYVPVGAYNGTSDYYVQALWILNTGTPDRIRTGTYEIGWPWAPTIDGDWRTEHGRNFTYTPDEVYISELNNGTLPVPLPSIRDTLDTFAYWGPSITLTRADVSVDIPPGESTRPTSWVGSGGLTVDGGNNAIWTVAEDATNPRVDRTLASRYATRLGALATWDVAYAGRTYGPTGANGEDWIIQLKANMDSATVLADWPEFAAITTEDVTNWDNSSYLRLTFDEWPESAEGEQIKLHIGYDIYTPVDTCINSFTERFGSSGTFSFTVASFEADFYATLTADGSALFDLGLLPRDNTKHLQHVTSAQLTLPLATGGYVLKDLALVAGGDPVVEFQQSPKPPHWPMDFHGAGCRVNGVTNLNLAYGYEEKEYVERGLKGQQYLQPGPGGGSDPTYAKFLSRLANELNWQEQFTAVYHDDTIETATVDDDDYQLGNLYWWDLERSVQGGFGTAIHVGGFSDADLPYCKQTFYLPWHCDGVAHGIAIERYGTDAAARRTGTGHVSESADDYPYKMLRRLAGATDWETVGSAEPDSNGCLTTLPLPEEGWEYAVRLPSGDVMVTTPYDTREFAPRVFAVLLQGKLTQPDTAVDAASGILHLVAVRDNDVVYTSTDDSWSGWRYGDKVPGAEPQFATVFGYGDHKLPSVALRDDGSLLVTATRLSTSVTDAKVSRNMGQTWEPLS